LKIDRLIAMTLHLLSHPGFVPARELAERFEVTPRTVARDVETLCAAGIPMRSQPGAAGGYAVMEGYRLDGRLVTAGGHALSASDRDAIVTALRGLLTAYGGERYAAVLEKISSLLPGKEGRRVFMDFGAAGEIAGVQESLKTLDKAIADKTAVRIAYVNAAGVPSDRVVEPVALSYRWYAWYLLAFCQTRQDYRVFKLARIDALETADAAFSREHGDPEELLALAFSGSGRHLEGIVLRVNPAAKVAAAEYLGAEYAETLENGDLIMRMDGYEDERLWFAMLLSFGDAVEVLEPEEVRVRLAKTAKKIIELYGD